MMSVWIMQDYKLLNLSSENKYKTKREYISQEIVLKDQYQWL